MSLSSSQCSIDGPSGASGARDFVFVKRENALIGLGLYHVPESGKGEPSVLWTNMELPAFMKKEMSAKMELVKTLPSDPQAQLEHLVKLGGEAGYHELCFGVVYTPLAVVWASSSGIVSLDRVTGKVLQSWDSFVGANRFWVDVGAANIVIGDSQYSLPTKRGGSFIADCHRETEQLLVYFNCVELIVLSSAAHIGVPSLLQRIPYDPSQHKLTKLKPSQVKAVIVTKDKVEVTIEGTVYL
jgi:hypothetical protein